MLPSTYGRLEEPTALKVLAFTRLSGMVELWIGMP